MIRFARSGPIALIAVSKEGARLGLGQQARSRIQQKFTLQQELEGNLDVYDKISGGATISS